MRTTLDIDDPILREVKALGKAERKSLGRVVSDLLASGLKASRTARKPRKTRAWTARPMSSRVDLADKDAVYELLDRHNLPARGSGR